MELWSGAFFPGYQCLASLGLMLTVVRPVCGPFSFMTLEKRMDGLPQLSREAERGEPDVSTGTGGALCAAVLEAHEEIPSVVF